MKAGEIRQKSAQELDDLLVELRKQQFELRRPVPANWPSHTSSSRCVATSRA